MVMLYQNQINPWSRIVGIQVMSMIFNRIYIIRHHQSYRTNHPVVVAVVVVIIIITIRDNQDNVGHRDASPITRSDTIQVRLMLDYRWLCSFQMNLIKPITSLSRYDQVKNDLIFFFPFINWVFLFQTIFFVLPQWLCEFILPWLLYAP